MKQLNRVERPLLVQVPIHPILNPTSFQKAIDNKLLVIDTRSKNEVAIGHIPGSLHIENGKSFSTWIGSLVDYQQQIVLITNENHMEDLKRKMMRIGMDNIYGFVTSLDKMNVALEKSDLVNIEGLKKHLDKKDEIIDVRTESEYNNGHIKGVENIVLTSLEKNLQKISRDKPVIVHCQSGLRAAMAYSIMKRNGIKNLSIYLGGINKWTEQKNELTK